LTADEPHGSTHTVLKIVVENLKEGKFSRAFIERIDRRTGGRSSCSVSRFDSDGGLFQKIVTGDESWCFA
jgi:hypothetical protein